MTIDEIKKLAREKLGQNHGWRAAICGNLLAFLTAYAINSTTQTICVVTGIIGMMQGAQMGSGDPEAVISAMSKNLLPLSVVVIVSYYVSAVFRYGISALSIAVMRGGARLGHAFSGFGKGWSTLWLMLLAHLYIFCWTLLFIIPGICAAFSYALIYLIKVDHPDWDSNRCIAESKRLMQGNRWRYFCLMLSFIGWWLLAFIPFFAALLDMHILMRAFCMLHGLIAMGLVFVFVVPYINTAQDAFYENLLDQDTLNNQNNLNNLEP